MREEELIMEEIQHTSDDFIRQITEATIAKEVQWNAGSDELRDVLMAFLGECTMLYSFEDFEAGADVVLAGYDYYEGEEEVEANIRQGYSLLLVDVEDKELLFEITDEDVDDEKVFPRLITAVETVK